MEPVPLPLYRLDRVLRLLCLRRFNDRFVILNDLFMMGWLWGSLLVRKKKVEASNYIVFEKESSLGVSTQCRFDVGMYIFWACVTPPLHMGQNV
jgi:hypothetical protein